MNFKYISRNLVLLWCLIAANASAQVAREIWVQRYSGPVNSDDRGRGIVVDASGNVYVGGDSNGAETYYFTVYATLGYSASGVPLWTNRYKGIGGDHRVEGVAAGSNGNIYVTGDAGSECGTLAYSSAGLPLWTNRYSRYGTSAGANAIAIDTNGNVYVTGDDVSDYSTIAYSPGGTLLWSKQYQGPGPGNGRDVANAITVARNGNIIVTGQSNNGTNNDWATVAYSNSGFPLWTNGYNGPANGTDRANALVADDAGNIYVTGDSNNSSGNADYVTIAYSSAGVPLWTNRYNGPANGSDISIGIAVDNRGGVFVTGYSTGIGTSFDYATIAYSIGGVPLWTNSYNGPGNGDDRPRAIAVDSEGNVYVTGYSAGSGSGNDYTTIAYSNTGHGLWTNRYNGPGNYADDAQAIAVDQAGNIYVTGYSANTNVYSYDYDIATIKYSVLKPVPLAAQRAGNQLVLNWINAAFSLQTAPTITGPFTTVTNATSPYTNSLSGAQQYFRLMAN